jgi:glycosyltransferase involved in cell wall biosynthesis
MFELFSQRRTNPLNASKEEDQILTNASERLPKTLLLCGNIPPAPTGSSVIVGNLAKQFRPDEMVVLGAYSLGAPAHRWASEWAKLKYAVLRLPDGWRGERWLRWMQLPLLLLRAWWLLVVGRCKAILVVFPDETFLITSYILAWLTGKPLYPYFHNTYLEANPNSRLARWLQPRVFGIASHVFVMSEGMQRLYEANYPNLQCSALVHSFNQATPDPEDFVLPPLHQPLRLVLFGSVGASNADAASRFAELVHTNANLHLNVVSGTSHNQLRKLKFTGSNISIETVSPDVLMERLRQSDIVLLPHGFVGDTAEEIATIFPTRTIEALISGRPILAHSPKDSFLTEFLERNGCALIVADPHVHKLALALKRLCQDSDLREQLVRQALITARQFEASTVASYLRKVLLSGSSVTAEAKSVVAGGDLYGARE